MVEFKSGKESCDEFFQMLPQRSDININIANLLKELFEKGQLSPEKIRVALKELRNDDQNTK